MSLRSSLSIAHNGDDGGRRMNPVPDTAPSALPLSMIESSANGALEREGEPAANGSTPAEATDDGADPGVQASEPSAPHGPSPSGDWAGVEAPPEVAGRAKELRDWLDHQNYLYYVLDAPE